MTYCAFLQFHLSTSQVGLMFLIGPGVYTIIAPICGMIADKTVCIVLCIFTILLYFKHYQIRDAERRRSSLLRKCLFSVSFRLIKRCHPEVMKKWLERELELNRAGKKEDRFFIIFLNAISY